MNDNRFDNCTFSPEQQKAEQAAKMQPEKLPNAAYGIGLGGAIYGNKVTYDEPAREILSERFRQKLNKARQESNKTAQLDELNYLLDKHPEVKRILDLIDALGDH